MSTRTRKVGPIICREKKVFCAAEHLTGSKYAPSVQSPEQVENVDVMAVDVAVAAQLTQADGVTKIGCWLGSARSG